MASPIILQIAICIALSIILAKWKQSLIREPYMISRFLSNTLFFFSCWFYKISMWWYTARDLLALVHFQNTFCHTVRPNYFLSPCQWQIQTVVLHRALCQALDTTLQWWCCLGLQNGYPDATTCTAPTAAPAFAGMNRCNTVKISLLAYVIWIETGENASQSDTLISTQ